MSRSTTARRKSTLAIATLVAFFAAGAAIAEDYPELVVTLGTDDNVFNPTTASVFQLAEDLGFYDRHQVRVTFVGLDGSPLAAAALQSGAVDVAHITIDAAIRLAAGNNLPVRGFLAVEAGTPFLIAARADIATSEDLAGHSFAISDNGGLDHALTQEVLRSFGIDPEAPSYVAIGAPSVRVQALAVSQVDATTVSVGTFAAVEDTPGLHVLVPPEVFTARAPAQSKFLVAREETLEEKHEAVQRFTDALMDAARAFAADPEIWVDAAAAARPDLNRETIERIAGYNAMLWCVNGCIQPDALQLSMDFIYTNPDFANVPVIGVGDIVDFSFTDRTLEEMGAARTAGVDSRS